MEHDTRPRNIYWPLAAILAVITLTTLALWIRVFSFIPMSIWLLMNTFMGLFFIVFALFKLIDLKGFVDGFAMYDLITRRWRGYGYIYPFMELALGLFYLPAFSPIATNIAALLLMVVTGAGVIAGLRRNMNLRCACLGTALNLPLSTVSAVENIGMGAMALLMLFREISVS